MSAKKARRAGAVVKLVIWSLVLILLVSIFTVSMVFGISASEIGIHTGFPLFSGYVYDESDDYNVGDVEYLENIEKIDIEWIAGNASIQIYDGDCIRIDEHYDGDDEGNRMRTRIKDGTLYIKYAASGRGIFGNVPSKELTVSIPSKYCDTALERIDIESVSANISIGDSGTGLCCGEIDIETVSGRIDVVNAVADRIRVESISGRVIIDGDTREIAVSSVSSGIEIRLAGEIADEIDVETVSGNIEIKLPSAYKGFTATLESVSGEMSVDSDNVGERYKYGNGYTDITLSTVSGDSKITLYE